MLWNLMMHALMGWLGAHFFLLNPERIGIALLVVCITQAVDQVRIRKMKWAEVEALPKSEREAAAQHLTQNINRILVVSFVQGVALFSAVLLFTAHAARTNGWL